MNAILEPSAGHQVASHPERYMDAARRMELLHVGPYAGVVYWHPHGLKLYEKLRRYIRGVHRAAGYQEVKSPSLVGLQAFEQSGHLQKYRDLMFLFADEAHPEDGGYALRPMSCPNHIELYRSRRRSHRELPLALFEFGEVFRHEASGALQVLFRMRQFCQDDSHVFVAPDGVAASVAKYLAMARQVYADLGFDHVEFAISLRPAQRFGDDALWDKAEQALRDACHAEGLAWDEEPGGGAFYGPKIELKVRDKLGRRWQLGVIQLDYVLPERFDLEFVDANDGRGRPVMLHHAVLGSLERMIGILLEVHGVDLPRFLHPVDAVVVSVSAKSADYARACHEVLGRQIEDVVLDVSDAPLPAKIAQWKSRGVPSILVVGDKEAARHAAGEGMFAMESAGARRAVEIKG